MSYPQPAVTPFDIPLYGLSYEDAKRRIGYFKWRRWQCVMVKPARQQRGRQYGTWVRTDNCGVDAAEKALENLHQQGVKLFTIDFAEEQVA